MIRLQERKKNMLDAQPQTSRMRERQAVPDGVLVEQARAGDQHAFEVLVNRYHRPLASFVGGLFKDDEQVSDVLQQVYLQLYLSLSILLTTVPLRGWLFQVARNRCLDELRRRHRKPEVHFSALQREDREEGLSLLEAIRDPAPLPGEITESSELHSALHAAMASLPPRLRPVVHLRCFRELTFAEIAGQLNLPETTVKTSFYRALPRLRRALTSTTPLAAVS
jgi:RNA polymerase sigma factor (sigma-70 family)